MGWKGSPGVVLINQALNETPDHILKFSVSDGHWLSPSAISIESSFSARPDNVELPHLSGLGGLSLDISPLEIIRS